MAAKPYHPQREVARLEVFPQLILCITVRFRQRGTPLALQLHRRLVPPARHDRRLVARQVRIAEGEKTVDGGVRQPISAATLLGYLEPYPQNGRRRAASSFVFVKRKLGGNVQQ